MTKPKKMEGVTELKKKKKKNSIEQSSLYFQREKNIHHLGK